MNLANANLLDDSVANSSSLKNQRIQKTAHKAINPQPSSQPDNYESMSGEVEMEEEVEREDIYSGGERKYEDESSERGASDSDNEGKNILGMKPALFYTLLAVGLIVGGVYVYNKFIKKGKKGLPASDSTPKNVEIGGK